MPNIQVAINTMWEMTANVFLIVCISSKTDLNALNAAGICNNNFVCDTNSGVIR